MNNPTLIAKSAGSLREAFGKSITKIARINKKIVILDADLAGGTGCHHFLKKYPKRFFQCGIAEQNMISVSAGMASLGSGVAHNKIPNVLGITKAYTTRVGEGPMTTELFDEIGNHLAIVGKEKGTVTGRDRRCGWFDAPQVRKTCMLNGVTSIALMKIDVLDELEEIKIFNKEYITMPGWKTSTIGITKFEDLPIEAKEYIAKIEELVGVEVGLISTGPERDQTIFKKDAFF